MDEILDIRKKLIKLSDKKYKNFSSSLIPNCQNMLGVRLPVLRKIAFEISNNDYYINFLNSIPLYFEETMLKGFVIGYLKKDLSEILPLTEKFIPEINNWSVCDSFAASLKTVNKNKPLFYSFMQKYLFSKKEFEIRFSLVILLFYYIEKTYLDEIFLLLHKIYLKDYYAKMAAGWLISICYIKFPIETEYFLLSNKIDTETHNKGIQKIIESTRIKKETKEKLKKLKR